MIEELRPFLGKSRERVKPRIAGFLSWLRSQQIQAGRGIRIHRTDVGTSISLAAPFPSFIGAFYANLNSSKVRVGPGFVNGIMPSNIDDEFPVNLKKKTYVFVEVKLTDGEKFDATAEDTVTIVLDTEKATGDKLRGRHPVAVVDRGRIWQLSYFSFNHSYRAPRHFFVPA
jgi:hypothetical protein